MKKLNLKKHVAIALAILSANGSMSVFAGGDGKGEQTSGSVANAPATDLRSQNHEALEVFYIFEKIFKQQLRNLYSKNGGVGISINNLDQLNYPEVRAAFYCIKSRIINRSEDQAVDIDDVLKELESTLKIKKVPEEMIDTILRALFTLVKYPKSLHLDMFINNVQNRTLYVCGLVNFMKINKTKAECDQAREELEKAEAKWRQAEAKWFQAEEEGRLYEAELEKALSEYIGDHLEFDKACEERNAAEVKWGGFQEANKII